MLFLFKWHIFHHRATNNWLLLTRTPRPTRHPPSHPVTLSWVCLPFLSSFWDQPFKNQENLALFQSERDDLFKELRELPRYSAIRKINDLVKRARPVTTAVPLLPPPSIYTGGMCSRALVWGASSAFPPHQHLLDMAPPIVLC